MKKKEFSNMLKRDLYNVLNHNGTAAISFSGSGITFNGEVKDAMISDNEDENFIFILDDNEESQFTYFLPDEDAPASYSICQTEEGSEYGIVTECGVFSLSVIGL